MKDILKYDLRVKMLRISIGMIYLMFGVLKFFDNLSPAKELASQTLMILCFGVVPGFVCYFGLAIVETVIGLMLIANKFVKQTIKLTLVHLLGTFTPIILLPGIIFTDTPFSITLIGQYILKNLIIFCALFVIYPNSTQKE